MFRVGRPKEWLFTGQDGTVLMKSDWKLQNNIITDEILKLTKDSSVAATAYSYSRDKTYVK